MRTANETLLRQWVMLGLIPRQPRRVDPGTLQSWITDRVLAKLEERGVAFCISDTAGRYPYAEAVTADFVYIRLHGSRKLYASDYNEEELQAWAEKIRQWKRETYIYFDNDFGGYAPKNAARLKEILGSA